MPGTRYWPKWNYTLPEELLAVMDEYHILKVPLLGQHYLGGEKTWCGRTSCSMAYNYYQVVQSGGDEAGFKPNLITHWNADQPGYYVDLRYPAGQRAFHTLPTEGPHNQNLSGYAVSSAEYKGGDVDVVKPPSFEGGDVYHGSRVLGFSYKKLGSSVAEVGARGWTEGLW